MRVIHIYNQWQAFHISDAKAESICLVEGPSCIFYWLNEDRRETFMQRYGSFASFTSNGEEVNLWLNVDTDLLPSIINWIQTGETDISPELIELASVMGFRSMVRAMKATLRTRSNPLKMAIYNAITKGINKDVAIDILDRFFDDHQCKLSSLPIELTLLFQELDQSTEIEHII